jgi:hypothetical protein
LAGALAPLAFFAGAAFFGASSSDESSSD